jgi:hypothetical protein
MGHHDRADPCPLLGVKQTSSERIAKSNTVTVHLPPNFGPIARSRLAFIDSQFRTEWKQTVSSNWCPHLSQDHMLVVYMLGPFWRDNSGAALRTLGA